MNKKDIKVLSEVLDFNSGSIDFLIDQMLKDSLLRDIPFLGSILAVIKSRQSISDCLLLKRIIDFYDHIDNVNESDRARFLSDLEGDKNLRARIAESIILSLDSFSESEKPEILAQIFSALLRSDVDFETFRRLSLAVNLAHFKDLTSLSREGDKIDQECRESLLRTGLTALSQHGISTESSFGEQTIYVPIVVTSLGKTFIKITRDRNNRVS